MPFGEVLTADRYMYFAIIGLSVSIFGFIKLSNKQITIITIFLVIVLGSLSFLRLNVWQNSIALYKDILIKDLSVDEIEKEIVERIFIKRLKNKAIILIPLGLA